ncbi:hypothetical protein BHM03_00031983 [Ensete ventricosum]|nr:hypothetical protein BHM03_00031983 [Ensete ventricosum]
MDQLNGAAGALSLKGSPYWMAPEVIYISPPAIRWYHRLGLFLPRYYPKSIGNGRFRLSSAAVGRYQPREKEKEGEEKGEPGDTMLLSRSRSVIHGLLGASRGESLAIVGRRKRCTVFSLLVKASRGDFFSPHREKKRRPSWGEGTR